MTIEINNKLVQNTTYDNAYDYDFQKNQLVNLTFPKKMKTNDSIPIRIRYYVNETVMENFSTIINIVSPAIPESRSNMNLNFLSPIISFGAKEFKLVFDQERLDYKEHDIEILKWSFYLLILAGFITFLLTIRSVREFCMKVFNNLRGKKTMVRVATEDRSVAYDNL